jgi:hypothetical protein
MDCVMRNFFWGGGEFLEVGQSKAPNLVQWLLLDRTVTTEVSPYRSVICEHEEFSTF